MRKTDKLKIVVLIVCILCPIGFLLYGQYLFGDTGIRTDEEYDRTKN